MNDENVVQSPVEILPPEDPRNRVQSRVDVVEVVRRAADREVKRRGRPPRVVVETATNAVKKATKKPEPPKEDERQRQAFEYYLELGESRTLALVAGHFGLRPDLVGQWSRRKNWAQRIRDLENRNVGQIIEDTGLQVILNKLQGMFIPDPINPKKVIIDPRASVGAIRDLISSFVTLDKNSRERQEEGSGDSGTGKGKNQVMVNVIFET